MLPVALHFYTMLDLKLLLETICVFKEIVVFLTLKQKRVLLVASLFDLKVDSCVLDANNGLLGLEFSL